MKETRIKLNLEIADVIERMSGGNPGAITALIELIKNNPVTAIADLLLLDELNIYEERIYMLWNDCCGRDINKLKKVLNNYRLGKIKEKDIKERLIDVGYGLNFDDLIVD